MKLCKCLFVSGLVGLLSRVVFAAGLVGTASVNVTSDTAATAKKMAFDEARRQIISDVLGQYADADALRAVVAEENSAILTTLIASSSISGERQSDTTYSANISMSINRQAAKNWMNDNAIQNWLIVTEDAGDKFFVFVDLSDKLSDWAQIRRAAANAGIDLDTQFVDGNQMVFAVLQARRSAFTILARENGWRYRNMDGNLRIFR